MGWESLDIYTLMVVMNDRLIPESFMVIGININIHHAAQHRCSK